MHPPSNWKQITELSVMEMGKKVSVVGFGITAEIAVPSEQIEFNSSLRFSFGDNCCCYYWYYCFHFMKWKQPFFTVSKYFAHWWSLQFNVCQVWTQAPCRVLKAGNNCFSSQFCDNLLSTEEVIIAFWMEERCKRKRLDAASSRAENRPRELDCLKPVCCIVGYISSLCVYRNRGKTEASCSMSSWALLSTRHKACSAAQVCPGHLEQQDKAEISRGMLAVPCRLVLCRRISCPFWHVQLRALLPSR